MGRAGPGRGLSVENLMGRSDEKLMGRPMPSPGISELNFCTRDSKRFCLNYAGKLKLVP